MVIRKTKEEKLKLISDYTTRGCLRQNAVIPMVYLYQYSQDEFVVQRLICVLIDDYIITYENQPVEAFQFCGIVTVI